MHFRILTAALFFLLIWFPTDTKAGQLITEGLSESVSKAAIIVIGTIIKAVKPSNNSSLHWEYKIKILEVIKGKVGRRELPMTFTYPDYSQSAKGGYLPFSPIVGSSGLEHELRAGKKYVMLFSNASDFDKSKDQPAILYRAEPLSSKEHVTTLLGDKSDPGEQ